MTNIELIWGLHEIKETLKANKDTYHSQTKRQIKVIDEILNRLADTVDSETNAQ